jgi:hypothetical protein
MDENPLARWRLEAGRRLAKLQEERPDSDGPSGEFPEFSDWKSVLERADAAGVIERDHFQTLMATLQSWDGRSNEAQAGARVLISDLVMIETSHGFVSV